MDLETFKKLVHEHLFILNKDNLSKKGANEFRIFGIEALYKQLMLGGVGNSSDLIVVELSDDEIKIISEQELKEWQQSAIEFDGFESWIVRGLLVKNR